MSPRAVLLDFGNTLVSEGPPPSRTDEEGARALETHLARRLFEGEAAQVTVTFLRLRREGIERARRTNVEQPSLLLLAAAFSALGLRAPSAADLEAALDAFFAAVDAGFEIVPGAGEALDALRAADFRLALVSNNTYERLISRALDRFGLRRRLDTFVHSSTFGVRKPDPRIFQAACEALGAEPRDCVHVGDLPLVDVAGARAAGMKAVLARVVPGPPPEAPGDAPEPDAVVEDLRRLPGIARALLAG